jgi:hypothetical protein
MLFSSPFRSLDHIVFRKVEIKYPVNEPPVCIVGHWRSGTTLLHNYLTRDDRASYVTTYQAVYPHLLNSKWLFRPFMRSIMPKRRPSDNVLLDVDMPQEDEYALTNMTELSYYHFLSFPQDYKALYRQSMKLDSDKRLRWMSLYRKLAAKTLHNSPGEFLVFKNPMHTGRMSLVNEAFPVTRFVFIHRNPILVYLSAKKFFTALIPNLTLQEVTKEEIGELILWNYKTLLQDYLKEKVLIPENQLIEVSYDALLQNPLSVLEQIYQYHSLSNFPGMRKRFMAYWKTQEKHKPNKHRIGKQELDRFLSECNFAMDVWHYDIPHTIEVVTDH